MEDTAKIKERIIEIISKINPSISSESVFNLCEKHVALLMEENKKFNLTSIKDKAGGLERHILDSILLMHLGSEYFSSSNSVLDIGSGGGYPGIPMGIIFPEKTIMLLESTRKKVAFLEQVIREMGLENIKVLCGRAEDFAREKNFRGAFDLVVSRALAKLPVVIELSIPFLKIGGFSIAMKGKSSEKEIKLSENALTKLNAIWVEIIPYSLISPYDLRLVIMKKIAETPIHYPRKPGIPQKKPL